MFKNFKKLGFEVVKLISLTAAIILIVYGIIHFVFGV